MTIIALLKRAKPWGSSQELVGESQLVSNTSENTLKKAEPSCEYKNGVFKTDNTAGRTESLGFAFHRPRSTGGLLQATLFPTVFFFNIYWFPCFEHLLVTIT